jgi:hypothetical protein
MKKVAWIMFLLLLLTPTLIPVAIQQSADPTFVAMYGMVTDWGLDPAYGMIAAFAEVPDEWARVRLFWIPGEATILSLPANYTFYTAKINVTYEAKLDHLGFDFYVSGLWNVYKITIRYDGNGTIIGIETQPIAENAFGELKVFNSWTQFTVEIAGIQQPIAGLVREYRIASVEIPRCDLDLNGEINIFDLIHVARRHGTKPGLGIPMDGYQYDFDSDLNSDNVIDVEDLAIIAKDFGKTY